MKQSSIILMGAATSFASAAITPLFGVDPTPYIAGFQVLLFTGVAKHKEESQKEG